MKTGWYLVIAGGALGLADAYLAGKLPGISPTTSSATNAVSTFNNILPVPISFLVLGVGVFMLVKG